MYIHRIFTEVHKYKVCSLYFVPILGNPISDYHYSELTIQRTNREHSGNYSCVASNAQPAFVLVHIFKGEYYRIYSHEIQMILPSYIFMVCVCLFLDSFARSAKEIFTTLCYNVSAEMLETTTQRTHCIELRGGKINVC